ncbi:MAG TPA: DUF4350 domain-containing protein [Pyrinomonadaceae bacterium]|nr:DUF4350 domain-containing protein [Pyrinomonadaceae bacterium]
MRGRLAIFITVALMLVILVALNAASYVRVENEVLSEFNPDRSTFNADATGTRAFYTFLEQSGHQVSRWGRPPSALLDGASAPANFVVVGKTRVDVESEDAEAILKWVEGGGRLVIIDRVPPASLVPAAGGWHVSAEITEYPGPEVRPDNTETMTRGVPLITPAQPTWLVRDVAQVTRSRFAGRLHIYPFIAAPQTVGVSGPAPTPSIDDDEPWFEEEQPPPPPKPAPSPVVVVSDDAAEDEDEDAEETSETVESPAPVEHLADGREGTGSLLIDYPYGRGRVVILSDPFIVSNGGVKLADNLQLAANVVAGAGGPIAFDEYHHGHGATENPVFAYFAGTPVLWIFAQAGLIVLAALWTRGRRFARPLPAPHVDRRSKLEFVASMAELQERARAYDLAVENVYARTRRALARYAGLQPHAPHAQLAERVAARSGRDARQLAALFADCENAIAGAPTSARKAVALVRSLRELERDLGILMRAREVRQSR